MSNQWLRLWHELPNDPKWRTISRASGQPISLVISIYIHLLVDASRNVTRGHVDVTTEDLASALDVTEEQISAVLSSMEGRVIENGHLTGWENRQPKKEDQGNEETGAKSSTERKRLQREREKLAFLEDKKINVTTSHDESRNVTLDKDKDKELITTTTTPRARDDEKFLMIPDWKPSEQLNSLIRTTGMKLPATEELNASIAEFIAYWLTKEVQRSQHEWEHAFVKSLKYTKAKADSAPKPANKHGNFEAKNYGTSGAL